MGWSARDQAASGFTYRRAGLNRDPDPVVAEVDVDGETRALEEIELVAPGTTLNLEPVPNSRPQYGA